MDVTTAVVLFAIVAAAAGIGYGLYLTMWVIKLDAGNKEMQSIAQAIQEGASAYLNRQYKAVGVVAAVLFVVLWLAGMWSDKFGLVTAIGFLIGASASALAGYVGMNIAVRANVRTAQAAHNGLNAALQVAFRGGAVTGLLLIGLALLSVTGPRDRQERQSDQQQAGDRTASKRDLKHRVHVVRRLRRPEMGSVRRYSFRFIRQAPTLMHRIRNPMAVTDPNLSDHVPASQSTTKRNRRPRGTAPPPRFE